MGPVRWLGAVVVALLLAVAAPASAEDTRIDAAWESIDQEDWDTALELADAVLADTDDPADRFAAREVLATLSYYLDEIATATEAAVALDQLAITGFGLDAPQRLGALELLALLASETGDLTGAVQSLSRAIQIGRATGAEAETNLFYLLRLAGLYADNGQPQTAAVLAADVWMQAETVWGEADEIALEAGLMRALAHLEMDHPIEALVHALPALIHGDQTALFEVPSDLLDQLDTRLSGRGDETQVNDWIAAALERRERRAEQDNEDTAATEELQDAILSDDVARADRIAERITATAVADDPFTVQYHIILLQSWMRQAGQTDNALRWARRIMAYPPGYLATLDHDLATLFLDLSDAVAQSRRFGEALRLAQLATDLRIMRFGGASEAVLGARVALINLLISAGDLAQADALISGALGDGAGLRRADDYARVLLLDSERARARGADDAAVARIEQVLELRAGAGQTKDSIWWEALTELAGLRLRQGRNADAIALLAQAHSLAEQLYGSVSTRTHVTTVMQTVALFNDGQTEAAMAVFDAAQTVYRDNAATDDPLRAALTLAQSRMLRQTGEEGRANALFAEAVGLSDAASGQADPSILAQLASESWSSGRLEQAQAYANQTLAAASPGDPVLPMVWDIQARLARQAADLPGALGWLRKLTAATQGPEAQSRASARAHLPLHVETALALAGLRDGAQSVALIDEAFDAAQGVGALAASAAFDRAAARWTSSPDLSTRIRALQDTERQLDQLRGDLNAALGQGEGQDGATLTRLRQTQADASAQRAALRADFPDYADVAYPRPADLAAVAGLLRADEVLLIYATSDEVDADDAPISQVIAVTRDQVQTAALAAASDLADLAGTLRCAAALTDLGCGTQAGGTRGTFDMNAPEPDPAQGFDLALAHLAYQAVLDPVSEVIAGKSRLIVVPDGALLALPFNLLIRTAPGPDTGLREADWLLRDARISVMPTVASFARLRARGSAARSTSAAFLGVGDPLIGAQRDGPVAFDCGEVTGETVLALARTRSGDGDALATLSALPDSRCELRASAAAFPGPSQVLLHDQATETALRALSASGRLAEFSAITFATHGLIAGEVGRFDAGLVLTPPAGGGVDDDGLLTSSEVADLRLNADVVILSACNTAAGTADSDEGLSGLASAFFYAGARSVMVSHWPVYSDAATRLSSATLARMANGDALDVADALRLSMLDVLNDPNAGPRELHPAYWAAFFVAGGV